MGFIGTVKNGVVVLPPRVHLNDGDSVEVTPVVPSPEEEWVFRESATAAAGAGTLPDDLAINHDFYLHGLSKQQPRRGRWLPSGESARELTEQEATQFSAQLKRFGAETRNFEQAGFTALLKA